MSTLGNLASIVATRARTGLSPAPWMDTPVVFQCAGCRRVVSDSNQLVAAIAALDVLVVDAVVGVAIGEAESSSPDGGVHVTLSCGWCEHVLGRLYRQAPSDLALPAPQGLVHRDDAPRYSLLRGALESYALGTAGLQRDGEAGGGSAGGGGGRGGIEEDAAAGASTLVARLEAGEADVRTQLAQLMRVVLGLDGRLRSLESHADDGERKRQR